jgi:hypothetical protein
MLHVWILDHPLLTYKIALLLSATHSLGLSLPAKSPANSLSGSLSIFGKCIYIVILCTTKVVVELVKQQGIGFNSPPPFFPVVTGSNSFAVVVREPDATKKGLYQVALWWGCGDGLAFQGSSYGSNRTFHNGWEPRWSRPRGKITLVAPSRLFA